MNDTAVQSGADNVKNIINISVDLHSMKEEEGYGGG